MSDGSPKLIAIDEQPKHQVVWRSHCQEAKRGWMGVRQRGVPDRERGLIGATPRASGAAVTVCSDAPARGQWAALNSSQFVARQI